MLLRRQHRAVAGLSLSFIRSNVCCAPRKRPFTQSVHRRVGVDGPRRHRMCQNEVVADLTERGPPMEQISRIGMDTSKRFFQLHGVNTAETVVLRKKLRRKAISMILDPAAIGSSYLAEPRSLAVCLE
jgi:hypothetical protein